MSENGLKMGDIDARLRDHTWALVISGNRELLVRFPDQEYRGGVKEYVAGATGLVMVEESYELLNRIIQDQQGNVGKQTMVMPNGAMLHPTRSYVRIDHINFFDDMQKDDRNGYESHVRTAVTMCAQARLARMNLALPGQDDQRTIFRG